MPTAAAVTAFLGQYAHSMLGCVQLREYMHTLCTIKSICAHTLCAIKPSLALIGYCDGFDIVWLKVKPTKGDFP